MFRQYIEIIQSFLSYFLSHKFRNNQHQKIIKMRTIACAALLLLLAQSALAGSIKGSKVTPSAVGRRLKKKRISGPKGRSCSACK